MLDFHTHSRASDGSDTPAELLHAALQAGLTAIALTDHDTLSGLPEFLKAAEGQPITAVPGVEISSSLYNKEIHIVGLFIDPHSESLNAFLENARENRNLRNRIMLEKLSAMGYAVTEEEVRICAGGESVGRPHMAQMLVQKGFFPTIQDAFDRCLKRGARAYTPRVLASPDESIRAIHDAGGLAFWAHPVYRARGERSMVRRFLRVMTPHGLDGIETCYPVFTARQTEMLSAMAKEFGLLRTGGTDYHGIYHPGIRLGCGDGSLIVPDELLDAMRSKLAERK